MIPCPLPFRPSDRIRMLLAAEPRRAAPPPLFDVLCVQGVHGSRRVRPEVECHGFQPAESADGASFAWTAGPATVVCRFDRPVTLRHVWLRIHAARPGGAPVEVQVDDSPPTRWRRIRGGALLMIPLRRRWRTTDVRLAIRAPTFVAALVTGGTDERVVGVAIERVILGRNLAACASAAFLQPPLPAAA